MKKGSRHYLIVIFLIIAMTLGMTSLVNAEGISKEESTEERVENPDSKQIKVDDLQPDEENNVSDLIDSSSQNDEDEYNSIFIPKLTVKEIVQDKEYEIILENISYSAFDFVILKVWNNQTKEDDAVLYPAEWVDEAIDSNGDLEDIGACYMAHVDISDCNDSGVYHVVAYGINNSESLIIEDPEDITNDMIIDEEVSSVIEETTFEVAIHEETTDDVLPEETEPTVDVPPSVSLKSAPAVTPISSVEHGIDVSKHNGVIDWAKVKAAGIKYAIIRCGYGDNLSSQDDARWTYNVSQCEALGIPYGVYIYSYATSVDHAKSEAAHCIRLLKGHHPAYPVFLDLEDSCMSTLSNATLASMTQAWANQIMAAGYTAGVYSSKNWWTNKLTNSVFNNYCKWVAQWNTSCTYAGSYSMWQYSSKGSVSGISGNVDMNYWYGYSAANGNSGISNGEGPDYGVYEFASTVDPNYVIDIAGASKQDLANVQLWPRNGTGAQKFWLVPLGYDNQYYIINHSSGKYLDVDHNKTADRTNVWQHTGNGSIAQRFRIINCSSETYEIQGVSSGKYLDLSGAVAANGTNIQIFTGNHSPAQRWKLTPVTDDMPEQKTYTIISSVNRTYALDIAGASKEENANVQLWTHNRTPAQQFTFIPLGHDDLYYIVNKKSGKSLDVAYGGQTDGTNVWQHTKNGTPAQTFQLITIAGGSFEICNVGSGKYLDVDHAKAAAGTNIQIHTGNHTPAQRWFLLKVD